MGIVDSLTEIACATTERPTPRPVTGWIVNIYHYGSKVNQNIFVFELWIRLLWDQVAKTGFQFINLWLCQNIFTITLI